jgi:hypothetical protein
VSENECWKLRKDITRFWDRCSVRNTDSICLCGVCYAVCAMCVLVCTKGEEVGWAELRGLEGRDRGEREREREREREGEREGERERDDRGVGGREREREIDREIGREREKIG